MINISHFFGGILLVVGTTIGAGMLALPVMTGFMGFFPSLLLFTACWLFMLLTALFFLDVNLAFKGETNMISMAGRTLGIGGKALAWITYLLLLYSLIAAYVAGSASIFVDFFSLFGIKAPTTVTPLIMPLLFGVFIYMGTLEVDFINRILMLGKGVAFVLLIFFIPEHVHLKLLSRIDFSPTFFAIPVIITSFGYHIIIPTLTEYLNHDKRRLRQIIIIGSIVPLLVYILWEFMILSTMTVEGKNGLYMAWKMGLPATDFLPNVIQKVWVSVPARFFTFFAISTSFVGVSLSLSDFLADGLRIKRRRWEGRLLTVLLTFLPPVIFVYFFPRGFILALEYAGAFVAILLGLLPAMMAWKLKTPTFYQTIKGRCLLIAVMLISLFIVFVDIALQRGYFETFLKKYV